MRKVFLSPASTIKAGALLSQACLPVKGGHRYTLGNSDQTIAEAIGQPGVTKAHVMRLRESLGLRLVPQKVSDLAALSAKCDTLREAHNALCNRLAITDPQMAGFIIHAEDE